jgi:Zn-dependent protease
MFFVLAAACTLYLSWLAGQLDLVDNPFWFGLLVLGVLVVSVALHVAAHVYATMQLGMPPEILVIGPLGDFTDPSRPVDPKSQLTMSLAGPAVNVLVALACLPGILASGQVEPWGLLNPLSPVDLASGATWLVTLKLTFWINWLLAVANLLPARPFDGGPCLLSIAFLIYPRASRRRIELFAQRAGVFTGLALVVFAILTREGATPCLVPPWFLLLAVGIVVLFSSQRRPKRSATLGSLEDELFGYDFSQGYSSLERSDARVDEAEEENGPLERWLETRREQRRERQQSLEAEEDQRVDDILARVHKTGLQDLTAEERALLERVSTRYRTRLDQP